MVCIIFAFLGCMLILVTIHRYFNLVSLSFLYLRDKTSVLSLMYRGADLFSLVCSDRMCGNCSKLHNVMIKPVVRKHFFTERVVKHWNSLPREVVDAPSLV